MKILECALYITVLSKCIHSDNKQHVSSEAHLALSYSTTAV